MDVLIMDLIFLLLMVLQGNTTWILIATIATLITLGVIKYGKRTKRTTK